MDFGIRDTEEQQGFRMQVRAWLEAHAPEGIRVSAEPLPLDRDIQQRLRQFWRQVGAQGWLAPAWPTEYGGGGLPPALAVVVQEELSRQPFPPVHLNLRWLPAMMVWGTEEQKRRFLPLALRGELVIWQLFNEPGSGSDLASIGTRAVQDGNEYLIMGKKGFISGRFDPDYLWVLAVTDPQRPRTLNLGMFMVEARLPGITMQTRRLLYGIEHHVFLDKVRVPNDSLIGGKYQGWEIVQSILEIERGGFGFQLAEDGLIGSITEYLREQRRSPDS